MTDNSFGQLKQRLVTAFDAHDWDKADLILRLARQKEQWEQQLALVTGSTDGNGEAPEALRECVLPVTYGGQKYSYLSVKRAVDDGILREREELNIRIPSTDRTFKGHVYRKSKVIYGNPELKDFYTTGRIGSDDFVRLKEVAPGEWILEKHDGPRRSKAS